MFRTIEAVAGTLALVLPSLALAQGTWDKGQIFTAPEFDAGAATVVAAIVIGGAILVARRRRG